MTITTASCALPKTGYEQIVLGHGSGGKLSAELFSRVFRPIFGPLDPSAPLEDQAWIDCGASRIAMTTDSFVVRPIFFPGGDIGHLAVHGTINDLAVGGARAQFLSAAFILEEGLAISDLERVARSMKEACDACGVTIVTGDTKVVDRGCGDKIFITTTGIGAAMDEYRRSIADAKPGDAILVSGTLGDHGLAVMSVREGIEFETSLVSDTAPLVDLVASLLAACPEVRCMRDPTRGGLASTLNELAASSRVGVDVNESQIPVRSDVRSACEILGLDPLYVANEGKLVCVVPANAADRALTALRSHALGKDAACIGHVSAEHLGTVTLHLQTGTQRRVALLSGEQLPRIC